MQEQPDGGKILLRKNKTTATWEPCVHWDFSDSGSDLHSLNKDGTKAYLLDCRGRNNLALVELDLSSKDTGTLRVLAESPDTADILKLIKDPTTGNPIAFCTEYAKTKWYVLDDAYRTDFEYLEKFEGAIDISSQSLDNTKWIITQSTASGVQYHIYNRETTSSALLFHSFDKLLQYTLNNMHSIVINSRDGQNLVSYLTIPDHLEDSERPGRPTRPIPLVLRVHGGPWFRDSFGFSADHQWLSNRGYAVLSVNFRSSTGFGKEFVDLGNGQWGKNMQNDLTGKRKMVHLSSFFSQLRFQSN
jgi:dipeptidyl aminopeptidase/acylaminoacyl peptidase